MKLKTKILVYISTLITVLVSLTTGLFINKFNAGLNESLETRGSELARLLSEDLTVALLIKDTTTIENLIKKRMKRPNVVLITISTNSGEVIFQDTNEALKNSASYRTFVDPVMWAEGSGNISNDESLLFEDKPDTQKTLNQIGTVSIGLSQSAIIEKRHKILKTTMILGLAIVLISLTITFFLAKKIIQPIESIARISGKIAQGDYSEGVRVVTRNDEIGVMVKAFNKMSETLQYYTEGLEDEVKIRTRELEQIHRELENKAFYAGMAEIARGVLHDVNNAMQGINSNLATIDNSMEYIDIEVLDNILDYMRNLKHPDNKWQDVIAFFDDANKLFAKSKSSIAKTLAECCKTSSHISEIISAQQKHAKAGSTKELIKVNSVLLNSLEMYRQSLEKRKILLEIEAQENLPELFLNEGELERLFSNFIKNAIDAMDEVPNKNHTFSIRSSFIDNTIYIKLNDTGAGINTNDLPNIFRSDFTTKTNGTGFGLSFCLDFMKKNDGEIHVNSVKDQGTEFLLTFFTHQETA